MNERVSEHSPQLLPATRDLLDEAETLVGVPIELRAVPALPNDVRASLRVPRGNQPSYILLYSERYNGHVDHLIAHELGHLRRLQDASPSERLIPISTRAHRTVAARQLEPDLRRLIRAGAPEGLVVSLYPVWVQGIVSQLTNTPADLRIERAIYTDRPALRDVQTRSLLDQVDALQKTLSLEVARYTPARVHHASLLMNYVLVREFSRLLHREDLLRPFAAAVDRRQAKDLYWTAANGPDEGYVRDRIVIDNWAQRLGLNGWFDWIELERLQHWPERPGESHES